MVHLKVLCVAVIRIPKVEVKAATAPERAESAAGGASHRG